jgi:hypothetical protein
MAGQTPANPATPAPRQLGSKTRPNHGKLRQVPLSQTARWRDHFAGVDLPVPVLGGKTVTGINFDNRS